MKIHKILYILLLTLCPIKYIYSFNQKSDEEKITEIFTKIQQIYGDCENIKIEFNYTKVNPIVEEQEIFVCDLLMCDESKYRLKIKKKNIHKLTKKYNENFIISDGFTKWTIIEDDSGEKEITISNYNSDDEDEKIIQKIRRTIISPTEWLNPVHYEKDKDKEIIELEPYEDEAINENIKIINLTLTIDYKTKEIISWRIENSDGSYQIFDNLKYKKNIKIKKDTFTYKVKKEDIDLINDIR